MKMIQKEERQTKGEASKSYVLLAAVQNGLEVVFRGWKFDIEGARDGQRKGADDYTLYGRGPSRENILVHSSNDKKDHMASAQIIGSKGNKFAKTSWDEVGKGFSKHIIQWIVDNTRKMGILEHKDARPATTMRRVFEALDE